MERYFFDVTNGNGPETDETGAELASEKDMRKLAISTLTRIANEEFPTTNQRYIKIHVRNSDGLNIFYADIVLNTKDMDK